ncbi:MAG: phage portal protein [Clostridiales bacterium]|nr:phage portal protein [Clostridiales bacterium]
MGWFKRKVRDWLEIVPVDGRGVSVLSDADFEKEIFRNKLWYRGNAAELAGFYGGQDDLIGNRSFWAEGGRNLRIRKIHSGLPALIVDVLSDIALGDFLGVRVQQDGEGVPAFAGMTMWDRIAEENGFTRLLAKAVRTTLALGDGAFKISFDGEMSEYPIVEYFGGDRVRFNYSRGRVDEIVFIQNLEDMTLEEIYHRGGIKYRLTNAKGEEIAGERPPDIEHNLGIMLAVPLIFDENPKFEGRGKSIFDGKIGAFDALDEVISQWVDALRDGRVQKYIPLGLLPRNPNNGQVQGLSSFESRFIQTEMDLAEGADNSVKIIQPQIDTDALADSYAGFLNLALQGILAPATLGLDLKRNDNAAAQREKEKATLYTRGKIIDGLRSCICKLVSVTLAAYDALHGRAAGDYQVQVEFGDYAAPDFGSQIEIVGRGVAAGIISHKTAVDQLYGDTWTQEMKDEEVARLCAKTN